MRHHREAVPTRPIRSQRETGPAAEGPSPTPFRRAGRSPSIRVRRRKAGVGLPLMDGWMGRFGVPGLFGLSDPARPVWGGTGRDHNGRGAHGRDGTGTGTLLRLTATRLGSLRRGPRQPPQRPGAEVVLGWHVSASWRLLSTLCYELHSTTKGCKNGRPPGPGPIPSHLFNHPGH